MATNRKQNRTHVKRVKSIGVSRLFTAWGIGAILILLTFVLINKLLISIPIALLITYYFFILKKTRVSAGANRIQAYQVFGRIVESHQLIDEKSFIYWPIETTSKNLGFEKKSLSIDIMVSGVSKDRIQVDIPGITRYTPESAPALLKIQNPLDTVVNGKIIDGQVSRNLKALAASAGVKGFPEATALEIMADKDTIIDNIEWQIEEAIKTELGYDDEDTAVAALGVNVNEVSLKDPIIPKKYTEAAAEKVLSTLNGEGKIEMARQMAKGAKVITETMNKPGGREGYAAMERATGIVPTTETIYNIKGLGGVGEGAGKVVGDVKEIVKDVGDFISGKGRFSSRKAKNKPETDAEH